MSEAIKLPNRNQDILTLSDKTTALLRDEIIAGRLAPGHKINEVELAKRLCVSRGPLREAIRRLVAMRLVSYVPNQGARVIRLSSQHISDLYEVRECLESKAATLAARNMTVNQIDALNELLDTHRQYLQRTQGEYLQEDGDYDFHYQIIKGSGNQLLIEQLCDELYHLIRMFRRQTSRFEDRSDQALREHEQLVYAIEHRNESLAEEVMKHHIQRAHSSIKEEWQKRESQLEK